MAGQQHCQVSNPGPFGARALALSFSPIFTGRCGGSHWSLLPEGSFWWSLVLTLMACNALQQGTEALGRLCGLDFPDHHYCWSGKARKTRTLYPAWACCRYRCQSPWWHSTLPEVSRKFSWGSWMWEASSVLPSFCLFYSSPNIFWALLCARPCDK